MFVVHSIKLIFIAVPGTGTTSFEEAMNRAVGKQTNWEIHHVASEHPASKIHPEIHNSGHFTAEQCRMVLEDEIWKSYEKVAFVREPFMWARGIYRKLGNTFNSVGIDVSGSFVEFLERLEKTPYFWMTDRKGKLLVDTIYRTEDLEHVFEKYKLRYRHSNRTPNSVADVQQTPEVKKLLRKKFRREYKHYD